MKKNLFSNLIWSFGERITAQLVTFIVSVILARMLSPSDYGVVSLILVFITLANVFVSDGFGAALIQKQNAGEIDFSTMFWCSFLFSLVLYAVLFVLSPAIARFYGNDLLCPLVRVLAVKLPISAFSTIQHAYVSKRMQFKKFFFSTLGGTLVSGVVGILMAYYGFGAWAIVMQYLTNTAIDTVVLLFTIPWRPHILFDKKSANGLLSFGWKMTLSSFINTAYSELRSLFIGRLYSAEALAQYKRGGQFPSLFITNINTAISEVLFPAISSVNDEIEKVREMTRQSLIVTSYLILPLMVGLGIVAEPLVRFLLTDKWLPCVPFLRLFCLTYALQPMQTANCQAIKAIGRSDIYLKMEIVKKVFGIGLLIIFMKNGVMAIALTGVVAVCFSALVSAYPNKKLIGYGYLDQWKDMSSALALCAAMSVVILPIGWLHVQPVIIVVLQTAAGIAVYLSLSVITKNKAFGFLKMQLMSFLRKN